MHREDGTPCLSEHSRNDCYISNGSNLVELEKGFARKFGHFVK